MSDIILSGGHRVAEFKPEATLEAQAKLDALIGYARKIDDWSLVREAVQEKVRQQAEFVDWWDAALKHGGDRSKNADPHTWSVASAEAATGIKQYQVSRWRNRLKDLEGYTESLCRVTRRQAFVDPQEPHRASGTGESEWYTPCPYIEAARMVMGGIDLDPASNATAQEVVKAGAYFSKDNDGLEQNWFGRVWLNPPYGQPLVSLFVDKLITELEAGRVRQAILLTHNSTDTSWWHRAVKKANALCFTQGRIAFIHENGIGRSPVQGQCFTYFGHQPKRFQDNFEQFGLVIVL